MMSQESEEFIQTLKERIDYLERNLRVVEKALKVAVELKEYYHKKLNECEGKKRSYAL
jgi:F0F1-type ATP synthase membrane subunit b/b'